MANIINGTDTGSGGLITTGDSSDELQLQTAEVARVTLTNTAVVVNESGADVDFRVEGDTDANLLFVDASTDRVGVKTNAPSSDLHINPAADGIFTNGLRVQRATATTQNVVLNYSGGAANIVATDAALSNPIIRFFTSTDGTTSTERMRITSAGAVEIANGNLVFSTNGTGIDFSASAGGGASSSLLDDYEEGTYTATLTPSVSGSITLSDNTLSYTKIGRIVTVTGFIEVSGVSSPTGTYVALNLPFVINNSSTTRPSGSLAFNALGSSKAANIGWANGGIGSTNMEIYDGSVNSVGAGSFATYIVVNTTCRLTITYFTT